MEISNDEKYEYAKKTINNIDNIPIITDCIIDKVLQFHILYDKGHKLSSLYLVWYYLYFAKIFMEQNNKTYEMSEMLKLCIKYIYESYTTGIKNIKSIFCDLISIVNINYSDEFILYEINKINLYKVIEIIDRLDKIIFHE
jgi:hypothetical protein